jgi:hypothetical protein
LKNYGRHADNNIIIRHTTKVFSSKIPFLENEKPLKLQAKMPDRQSFTNFYEKRVSKESIMNKNQFIEYPEVQNLLQENLIFDDDIDSLWISAVGDSSGLNEDEAYEMLCMVSDLPDPEDVEYLDKEFKNLIGSKGSLSFSKFLMWQELQDMLNDEAVTMEDVSKLWRNVAGDLDKTISIQLFRKINNKIDDMLDEGDNSDEETLVTSVSSSDSFFEKETLDEFVVFFNQNKNADGKVTYDAVKKWEDISSMIEDKLLSESDVLNIWKEVSNGSPAINFDTFVQFNVNIDLLIDDKAPFTQEKIKTNDPPSVLKEQQKQLPSSSTTTLDDESSKDFYRNEFRNLMGGSSLMPLDILLEWKEMKELLQEENAVLTTSQVESLFNMLPREPLGLPSTKLGITVETFIKLNQIIDTTLDSKEDDKGANASTLVADAQLSEVTESELELMKMLDSADNLLNSGSFGDFDKLIGDENDPRLQVKEAISASKAASAAQDLEKLVALCRKQIRCGLQVPGEIELATIGELVTSVIQSSSPVVERPVDILKRSLNGNWKLLYTNSEMFRFYNGLTGFPNVFPATKFEGVTLKYTSDGFLNEVKYQENLSNPLGKLDATAFGNWDLVKEMSFMTNKQSVIIRAFMTKVDAGPLSYEAQENWKSLRTLAMNELVYIDEKYMIVRNCGALRVFFVLEKE